LFAYLPLKAQNLIEVSLTDFENPSLRSTMEKNTRDLLNSINNAFKSGINPSSGIYITSTAYEGLLKRWASPFKCLESEIIEKVVKKYGGGYELRNIPVFNSLAEEGDQNEELVLSFNSRGVIDEVLFALDVHKWNDLIHEGKTVEDHYRREVIVNFVEDFRNSYNRKDLSYLSKVYSEEALIITGRVIKSQPIIDGSNSFIPKESIEYQKMSKSQYINNMKTIFAVNPYINISFEDIQIVQHDRNEKVYGVSMIQNWNTTHYKDKGYLFLLIDFTHSETNPLIHVRTWQPNAVMESDRFKLDDFKVK
jgi:hypothetical protein